MKAEIILLMNLGLKDSEIVRKTGESAQLVYYYRKAFNNGMKRFKGMI